MNESEGTEEIKTFPLYPYLLQGQQALPNCKLISVGRPSGVRYTTPLPHPTSPSKIENRSMQNALVSDCYTSVLYHGISGLHICGTAAVYLSDCRVVLFYKI